MKLVKRMWLFVLICLVSTLLSFSVLGSTYAKYTSKVGGNAGKQAAGFLITATSAEPVALSASAIIAPGEDEYVTYIPIKYFSQVPTTLSSNGSAHLVGLGALANFSTLLSEYATFKSTHNADGNTPTALTDIFTIKFGTGNGQTITEAIASLLVAGGLTRQYSVTNPSNTDPIISAMPANATTPLTLNLRVTISWIEHNDPDWDTWDEFLGNKFHLSDTLSGVEVNLGLIATQCFDELSSTPPASPEP
ncbi:MAG: hypothetical protein IJS68_02530 [Clostridia bacterium]|nr:hypothetical protein [Clostridia bacterium]